MHAETLAADMGVVQQARGGGLRLPAVLLIAGLATGALALVRPRLAASAGAAALVAGGAVSAARGRRKAAAAAPPAPATTFLRSAGPLLAARDPLGGLLDSLAAALDAAVGLEGAEKRAGADWSETIAHPDAVTRQRLRGIAAEHEGGIVPAAMRTAEPCLLSGAAAESAGGLPGWTAARTTVAVPVRGAGGEVQAWLLGARPATGAEIGADDVALVEVVAALVGVVLQAERFQREAHAGLQAQSDFLAVMSHELKTPLNVIIGYADLVLMGLPEPVPPGARRNVERLRASARDLQERIEEILTYVRVAGGSGAPDEERTQVDAGALLREVAARTEPLARAKGLIFTVRTPPAPVALATYPEALGHVLELLLSNAVKFTYEGGVEVELSGAPAATCIRIRDSGIGIAPEHLEHIFEPFWQANPRATRRERGLGLGLTTARALARALGGDIAVESIPGAGSTVTICLDNAGSPPSAAG